MISGDEIIIGESLPLTTVLDSFTSVTLPVISSLLSFENAIQMSDEPVATRLQRNLHVLFCAFREDGKGARNNMCRRL